VIKKESNDYCVQLQSGGKQHGGQQNEAGCGPKVFETTAHVLLGMQELIEGFRGRRGVREGCACACRTLADSGHIRTVGGRQDDHRPYHCCITS